MLDKNPEGFLVQIDIEGQARKLFIRHWPTSDYSVFKAVIYPRQQYKKVTEFLTDREGSYRILDGGANVGYTSVYLKTI